MRVYHGIHELPALPNLVITFGSFDGVHLGHQEIFRELATVAHAVSGTPLVVTFEPHPRLVIYPLDNSVQLLTSLEEKMELMSRVGIEHLLILPFTVEFAQLNADEYIEKVILKGIRPHTIIIGYDHRFGLNRQGDINFLKYFQEKGNYELIEISAKKIDDIAISSTKIRNHLLGQDLTEANLLLGHPFIIKGEVIKGFQKGRDLGFPTANLKVAKHKLLPGFGIYLAKAIVRNEPKYGLLYIGKRPSLSSSDAVSVELYIMDYSGDLYGEHLTVELINFIRPDKQFDSLKDLVTQMQADEVKGRELIGQPKHQGINA